MSVLPVSRLCLLSALGSLVLALTGCAFNGGSNAIPAAGNGTSSGSGTARTTLGGKVYGGQQPISGAAVTLWAAGTSASYGTGASSIATTTTDSNGNFNFNVGSASPCTMGQYLYITSVGGNPGAGTNSYAAVMAALPAPCGAGTASTFVVVNEVTTVASVTALQQFMSITPGGSPAWAIGAPTANLTGLANAFVQVGNQVNIATGASVAGGFINYARVLIPVTQHIPGPLLALIVTAASTALAYRDVQTSTRLMLWIEALSVSMITVVLAILLFRNGPHLDVPQLTLQNATPSGIRLGVVLAIFSFVGFESATTLGHEARNPLRTIPRALIQSAVLSGLFFLAGAYVETFAFRQIHTDLGTATAPFNLLAPLAHLPFFGPLIATGTFVSMFACTLACITAAARVLLKMAHDGLVPSPLGRTHHANETPHLAVLTTGFAVLLPTAILSARGVSGMDIYGWMGSLAVYGFLTIYFLVAVALPLFLRRNHLLTPSALTLSIGAALAMILAMAGSVYPMPTEKPYNYLPYLYLAYLILGLAWFTFAHRRPAVGPGNTA